MRVSLATPSLLPSVGGPAYSVIRIGESLQACGVQTAYLVRRGADRTPNGSTLAAWWPGDVDLIHSFGVWTPLNHWACMSSRLAGRPLIICPMGMLEPWSLTQHRLRKRFAMKLYQRHDLQSANAVHATAEQEALHLRALGLKNPIAVIPHGVDIPSTVDGELRQTGGPRTALFLSRLHPKKGLMELVEAWAALRPKDWQLIVAGPDEQGYRARVEAVVGHYGLDECIRFIGPVTGEPKRKLLALAEILVLPTYSENFGHVIPEALAHGVPVITTTAAPWRELTETRSGWWIDPGLDPLVDCLQHVCALSSAELRAMGLRGHEMVRDRYSWERAARSYLLLYRWLLRSAQKPEFVRD